jgi:DNA mismatch repair protein MutS
MVAEHRGAGEGPHGCKKLKVGYNHVFGYYIEVPNSYSRRMVPADYVRKQTLVIHWRALHHQELKELENDAPHRAGAHLIDAGVPAVHRAAGEASPTRCTASRTRRPPWRALDALCSLAEVAVENGYVRCPEVDRPRSA